MRINTLLFLSTIAIASVTSRADAQSKSCRPADFYGPALVAELTKRVTTTDPEEIAARDSFYHIPVVSPTAISLVTNESTCSRAAKALTTFENSGVVTAVASTGKVSASAARPTRQVIVVKLGTYWAVEDPSAPPIGHFLTVVIFDSKWRQVGGYTGP